MTSQEKSDSVEKAFDQALTKKGIDEKRKGLTAIKAQIIQYRSRIKELEALRDGGDTKFDAEELESYQGFLAKALKKEAELQGEIDALKKDEKKGGDKKEVKSKKKLPAMPEIPPVSGQKQPEKEDPKKEEKQGEPEEEKNSDVPKGEPKKEEPKKEEKKEEPPKKDEKKEGRKETLPPLGQIKTRFPKDAIDANEAKKDDDAVSLNEKKTRLNQFYTPMKQAQEKIRTTFPTDTERIAAHQEEAFVYLNHQLSNALAYLKTINGRLEAAGREAAEADEKGVIRPRLDEMQAKFSDKKAEENTPIKDDDVAALEKKLEAVKADEAEIAKIVAELPKKVSSHSRNKGVWYWLRDTKRNIEDLRRRIEGAIHRKKQGGKKEGKKDENRPKKKDEKKKEDPKKEERKGKPTSALREQIFEGAAPLGGFRGLHQELEMALTRADSATGFDATKVVTLETLVDQYLEIVRPDTKDDRVKKHVAKYVYNDLVILDAFIGEHKAELTFAGLDSLHQKLQTLLQNCESSGIKPKKEVVGNKDEDSEIERLMSFQKRRGELQKKVVSIEKTSETDGSTLLAQIKDGKAPNGDIFEIAHCLVEEHAGLKPGGLTTTESAWFTRANDAIIELSKIVPPGTKIDDEDVRVYVSGLFPTLSILRVSVDDYMDVLASGSKIKNQQLADLMDNVRVFERTCRDAGLKIEGAPKKTDNKKPKKDEKKKEEPLKDKEKDEKPPKKDEPKKAETKKEPAIKNETELAAAIVANELPKGMNLKRIAVWVELNADLATLSEESTQAAIDELTVLVDALKHHDITNDEVKTYLKTYIIEAATKIDNILRTNKDSLKGKQKELQQKNFELVFRCETNGIKAAPKPADKKPEEEIPAPEAKPDLTTEEGLVETIKAKGLPEGTHLRELILWAALHGDKIRGVDVDSVQEAIKEVDVLLKALPGKNITNPDIKKYLQDYIIVPCTMLEEQLREEKDPLTPELKALQAKVFRLYFRCTSNGIEAPKKSKTDPKPDTEIVPPPDTEPDPIPDPEPIRLKKGDLIGGTYLPDAIKKDPIFPEFEAWLNTNGAIYERKQRAGAYTHDLEDWFGIYKSQRDILTDLKRHVEAGMLDAEMMPRGADATKAASLRTIKFEQLQYSVFCDPTYAYSLERLVVTLNGIETTEREIATKQAQVDEALRLQGLADAGRRLEAKDVIAALKEGGTDYEATQRGEIGLFLTNISNNYEWYTDGGKGENEVGIVDRMFRKYVARGEGEQGAQKIEGWMAKLANKFKASRVKTEKHKEGFNYFSALIKQLRELQLLPRTAPRVTAEQAEENMQNLQTYIQEQESGTTSTLSPAVFTKAEADYKTIVATRHRMTAGRASNQNLAIDTINARRGDVAATQYEITRDQAGVEISRYDISRSINYGLDQEVGEELFLMDAGQVEKDVAAIKGGPGAKEQLEKVLVRWDAIKSYAHGSGGSEAGLQAKKIEILLAQKVHKIITESREAPSTLVIQAATEAYMVILHSDKMPEVKKQEYFKAAHTALKAIDTTRMGTVAAAELERFITDIAGLIK